MSTENTDVENMSERLARVALLIQHKGPITFEEIRGEVPTYRQGEPESIRRKFLRDKEKLEAFGYAIEFDPQTNCYHINESLSFAAPLTLTAAQQATVRMTCTALLADENYPFKDDLRTICAKLGGDLELPDMLIEGGTAKESKEAALARNLREAIERRKTVTFIYTAADGSEREREVWPVGSFVLENKWYLASIDAEKESPRLFRVDRMSKVSINTKAPGTPDFDEYEFDPTQWYGLPFQFGEAPLIEAMLHFNADNAWRLRRLTMDQGTIENAEEGGLIWRVGCNDAARLATWCVANGPGISIISPVEWTGLIADGLQRVKEVCNER